MATAKKAAAKPAEEDVETQDEVQAEAPAVLDESDGRPFGARDLTLNPDGTEAGPSSVTAVAAIGGETGSVDPLPEGDNAPADDEN